MIEFNNSSIYEPGELRQLSLNLIRETPLGMLFGLEKGRYYFKKEGNGLRFDFFYLL